MVLVLLFTSIVALITLYVYIKGTVDYQADENLFLSSRGSKTTKIYYNSNDEATGEGITLGDKIYFPKELESERVFGKENGLWCTYDEMPQNLKNAFIAIEDHRFFEHNGVDWMRTGKAAANYLLGFDERFGGSTITQQLIKNLSSDNEIKIERKLREILRAINIERTFSKEEILELYMNIVPMSENCVGVCAAAEIYFNKSIEELTLNECACIAAITNSPSRFNTLIK